MSGQVCPILSALGFDAEVYLPLAGLPAGSVEGLPAVCVAGSVALISIIPMFQHSIIPEFYTFNPCQRACGVHDLNVRYVRDERNNLQNLPTSLRSR